MITRTTFVVCDLCRRRCLPGASVADALAAARAAGWKTLLGVRSGQLRPDCHVCPECSLGKSEAEMRAALSKEGA